MIEEPVFYDPSGRRRINFAIAVAAFLLLLLLVVAAFTILIVETPAQQELPFEVERPQIHASNSTIGGLVQSTRVSLAHDLANASRILTGVPAKAASHLTVSFYAPWDDSSAASLERHISEVDWLVPVWVSVTGPSHHMVILPDLRGRAIIADAAHRPKLLPMIQNALNGLWDGNGAAALLSDAAARKMLLGRLEQFLIQNNADGATFDLEDLPAPAQTDYLRFLHEARTLFAAHHWLLAVAVPIADNDWKLSDYAAVADKLFIMAYDEHYPGGMPGPIASQTWFARSVSHALSGLPPDKVVVALGSYAYDWEIGEKTNGISVEQAWLTAHESDATPMLDRESGNTTFSYDEDNGKHHEVWMLDAASVYNEMAILRNSGVNSFAMWRLGTEDPSIWQIFGRSHRKTASADAIEKIPAGTDVDIEGTGEILRVATVPVPGLRSVTVNSGGLIIGQRFVSLPLPYAIQRTGYRPKLLALTFDDGPDPTWTPRILDILHEYHVPATFFIIGENALTQRALLKRQVREGHEVGNHTYTHPNLGMMTASETSLELNATQRLFQAFTGRSLRLFRAPYFGDAEPTTADEIDAVYAAQKLGYLSVGVHVDPKDWERPGVQSIINAVLQQVSLVSLDHSAQVILLHDGGGDRSQTVAALPVIIETLRARGYQFVPVSTLIGLPRDIVMPQISAGDRLASQAGLMLFSALSAAVVALNWLFGVAITLGVARALVLSALAMREARREAKIVDPLIVASHFISVLIPAFNEARVIETTIRSVLASKDAFFEIIVIDDGSTDGTRQVVERAFSEEPRVHVLALSNGGKARALNHGLTVAHGDVVVALDADTQFEIDTIARLARWFADPGVGAVAGNVKVGNRVNLVTRWQALEYITTQNLERSAFARLNAITVVPGAVGAWRTETLRTVGGYSSETLAEDQDLTITIQRAGWTVRYDRNAVAWTEAPESFRALARQRFRWAFGTLQCLWKHRHILISGNPRGLARIGMPQVALFQIVFASISPLIDLALIVSMVQTAFDVEEHGWARSQTDIEKILIYWMIFMMIDLLSGVIAFALERGPRWRLLFFLTSQRIVYRQVMYYVVIKAIAQAIRGPKVGWNKLDRSGRAKVTAPAPPLVR